MVYRENDPKIIAKMREDFTKVTEDEHKEVCSGGFIEIVDDEYPDGAFAKCPICEASNNLENLQTSIVVSGIGSRYLETEWEDLELVEPLTKVKHVCNAIGDLINEAQNAVFFGPPGSGKTQSAVMLVKSAIRAGHTAQLANIGRLGMEIREGYDGDGASEAATVRRLESTDLLVLDDVGAGETGGAKIEQRILYLVTESRQNAKKPTVITTNLMPQVLTERLGQRIINRLQPLTMLEFRHGKNFRVPKSGSSLWDAA